MSVLYIMLPAALAIAAAAVIAFIRAARTGQYDDLDTPAYRVLHEDESPPTTDFPLLPCSQDGTRVP